jgi:hypothetical protein
VWCRSWWANAPMIRGWPESTRRNNVFGRGICRPFAPRPMPATSRRFGRCAAVVTPQGHGRRPVSRWPQGWVYGQGKKHAQRGRVARIAGRAIYGKAQRQHVLSVRGYPHINTRVVERHNGTSRLRNQRQVRQTLAGSKAPRAHRWMRWLSVGLYNFCRGQSSGKSSQATPVQQRSPAMAAR